MIIENEMNLSFLSKSVSESFSRSAVCAFVMSLDPTVSEMSDIKLAVSEAVTNCIVHGYKDTVGKVYINAKITSEGKVIIKVRDKGVGIPDVKKAMEPLFTTGEDDRAGLGFTVMQGFMDKVRVVSKEGKGTTVTMEKMISPRYVNEKS